MSCYLIHQRGIKKIVENEKHDTLEVKVVMAVVVEVILVVMVVVVMVVVVAKVALGTAVAIIVGVF